MSRLPVPEQDELSPAGPESWSTNNSASSFPSTSGSAMWLSDLSHWARTPSLLFPSSEGFFERRFGLFDTVNNEGLRSVAVKRLYHTRSTTPSYTETVLAVETCFFAAEGAECFGRGIPTGAKRENLLWAHSSCIRTRGEATIDDTSAFPSGTCTRRFL